MRFLLLPIVVFFLMSGLLVDEVESKENDKEIELPPLHHVVDVKILKQMHPPKEFVLGEENKLECNTCHGIKDMQDIPLDDVDRYDDEFLRGGPYQKMTDFCYHCHDEEQNTRQNIHIMLDEHGEILEELCKFCHQEVLKRDEAKNLDEIKLRMPPEMICYGCHLKTPHLNALEHQVKPDDKKLAQLKKSVRDNNLYMPLSKAGKIMCVTCHTPHQPGVLDKKLAAAKQVDNADLEKGVTYVEHPWDAVYQADKQDRLDEYNIRRGSDYTLSYQRIDAEVLLRLPAKNGQLCLTCHTFEF